MTTAIDMDKLPVLKGIIDEFTEYLNSKNGLHIVDGAFTRYQIDGIGRDACLEELRAQTVDNWVDNMQAEIIDDRMMNVIVKCVQRMYAAINIVTDIPTLKHKLMRDSVPYQYTSIKIADTDFRKMSGIKKSLAVLPSLENLEKYLREEHFGNERQKFVTYLYAKGLHAALNYYTKGFFGELFSPEFRKTKGTYLKPVKLVRMVFGEDFDSSELSTLAGFIADGLRELHFKHNTSIVQVSEKPSEIYTLPAVDNFPSCMAGQDKDFFEIYDVLPNTSIAYICTDGLLRARALLHNKVKATKTGNTYKIMDRIYAEDADYLAIMKMYGLKNGYYVKFEQALDVDLYIVPEDESVKILPDIYISCNFTEGQFKHVPYMDTFHLLDTNEPYTLRTRKEYTGETQHKVRDYIDLHTAHGKVNWLCETEE